MIWRKKNTRGTRVAIVTDCPLEEFSAENPTSNLVQMIREFRRIYPNPTRVVNLREFHFNGGCLGCFKCAVTGKCAHKDGFDVFLREQIQSADATVYAFIIRDHSMGALFKMYDDRQFCNGHRTVTMGKPVGYIVDGNLEAEENLRMIMEARADVGHNFYAGAAASEMGLRNLALTLDYALQHKLLLPQTFYGVGGRKIFRDLIYVMRGMMRADHKFYKKNGFYDDLPNRQVKKILMSQLLGLLMRNPKVVASGKMNEGMLRPYKDVMSRMRQTTAKD